MNTKNLFYDQSAFRLLDMGEKEDWILVSDWSSAIGIDCNVVPSQFLPTCPLLN